MDVFKIKQQPRKRQVTVEAVTCDQHLGCAYCGRQIWAGQLLSVVVLDDQMRLYCNDDEQCAKQAGK